MSIPLESKFKYAIKYNFVKCLEKLRPRALCERGAEDSGGSGVDGDLAWVLLDTRRITGVHDPPELLGDRNPVPARVQKLIFAPAAGQKIRLTISRMDTEPTRIVVVLFLQWPECHFLPPSCRWAASPRLVRLWRKKLPVFQPFNYSIYM